MLEFPSNLVISPIPIVKTANANCIMMRYCPMRDMATPDKADITDDANE